MYYLTPNHAVAINKKVASSALAKGILETFYPHVYQGILNQFNGKPGFNEWQRFCPKSHLPHLPIVMIIRNPVDRFCTAVQQVKTTVEEALNGLEINGIWSQNEHFIHQFPLIENKDFTLFRFEDINKAADHLGIKLTLLNKARREKPILSVEQENRVRQYYIKDVELYNSCLG
jgi:hypothetical protein